MKTVPLHGVIFVFLTLFYAKVWQLKGFGWPAMDNESFLGQYRVDSLVIGTLIYFNYPVVKGAAIGG